MKNELHVDVALTKCFFCYESGDLLIGKTLVRSEEGPVKKHAHGKVYNMHPCSKCADLMKRGVIPITIDPAKSDPDWNTPPTLNENRKHWMPNPYRSGGWFVVIDDAIRRMMLPPEITEWALKSRLLFIDHDAAEKMGLFAATPVETR